jgi:DNA-binding transcriptional regulator GbsR (MarR family)
MKNQQAKDEFIKLWGALGSQWGINRSMAQIHALLLVSHKHLSTEDIMEQLVLSRGNANMNIRELINWNLIYKEIIPGERREYFRAEHDVWTIATRIISERKKRELLPAQSLIKRIANETLQENDEESKHIKKTFGQMDDLLGRIDQLSALMIRAEQNTLFKKMMTLLK